MNSEPSWNDVLKNLLFIASTLGAAYLVTVYLGLDGLREKVLTAGLYAPLIILTLKATTVVVVPLGGTVIYPVAGALFGFWPGLGLCLAGDAIGSFIAFFISRRFGRSVLRYFTSQAERPVLDQVIGRLGDEKKLLVTRIFFIGFMDLFAYAAGLTKVRFWFFILIHIAVHAIPASLYVVFGDLLVSGNWWLMIGAALAGGALALVGAWRFQVDLLRGN